MFLDAIEGTEHEALFFLLAMTGLRRSEACALTWSSLDLDVGWLEVRSSLTQTGTELHFDRPKTERARRRVELDPETVSVLRAHRVRQVEIKLLVGVGYTDLDLVFARPDGQPWKPDSITQAFGRLVAGLLVRRIRLHDLHHGHASYMLEHYEVNTVSDRLGHASAGFTYSTYGHSLPGRQAEATHHVAAGIRAAKPQGNQAGTVPAAVIRKLSAV